MPYDHILTLKRTSKYTYGIFAPRGHQLTELRATRDHEAEYLATIWASSFSSTIVEWEKKDAVDSGTPNSN